MIEEQQGFVPLRRLCQEHGRIASEIAEELRQSRFGDLGVSSAVAAELSAAWRQEDATRTAAEQARARAAAEKAERQRLYREGCGLLDEVQARQLDLEFTDEQIDKTSYEETLRSLEQRREVEIMEIRNALDAWTSWATAHPEMSEAVRLGREGQATPAEPDAWRPPKPNWVEEDRARQLGGRP